MERIKTERMVCIGPYIEYVQKTVDIPVLGGWISTVFCSPSPITPSRWDSSIYRNSLLYSDSGLLPVKNEKR